MRDLAESAIDILQACRQTAPANREEVIPMVQALVIAQAIGKLTDAVNANTAAIRAAHCLDDLTDEEFYKES
jgi:hypothetical protein